MNIIAIAFGGAIGAVLQYFLGGWVQQMTDSLFPWGTLLVNLVGSLAFGALWSLFELSSLSPLWRHFWFIGLLGAFTTFSTFSAETFFMLNEQEWLMALGNIVASVTGGLLAAYLGYHLVLFLPQIQGR